jgi:phage/plasmid primase-like uncharacterized protein
VSARDIAVALGRAERHGHDWRCLCPVHDGHSLTVADSRDGKLLIKCFAGCDSLDVFNELRARGLVDGKPTEISSERRREEIQRRNEVAAKAEADRTKRKIALARALYQRAQSAAGTPVAVYIRSRGITIPVPSGLRWLRWCPHRNGGYFPAMVAPIVDVTGVQVGIHKTFLTPDGRCKADLPKDERRETCGILKGGAVRLAEHCPGVELLVAEGIETTLSCMQMFRLPGLAALCTSGLAALELPGDVRKVVIAADNDENNAGQHAAVVAFERWGAEGRQVRILLPPAIGTDFNDVLLGK